MDPRLRRALSQALRVEILERIASDPASARQIAEACGEPLTKITYHTSILRDTGCIQPADPTSSDPGERVYEVTTLMPAPRRLRLSDSTRGRALASVLQRIVDSGIAALEAGILGKRDDSRISCESVVLDDQGWQEAKVIVDEARERLSASRTATSKRLARSGEAGIHATVAFIIFESPADDKSATG